MGVELFLSWSFKFGHELEPGLCFFSKKILCTTLFMSLCPGKLYSSSTSQQHMRRLETWGFYERKKLHPRDPPCTHPIKVTHPSWNSLILSYAGELLIHPLTCQNTLTHPSRNTHWSTLEDTPISSVSLKRFSFMLCCHDPEPMYSPKRVEIARGVYLILPSNHLTLSFPGGLPVPSFLPSYWSYSSPFSSSSFPPPYLIHDIPGHSYRITDVLDAHHAPTLHGPAILDHCIHLYATLAGQTWSNSWREGQRRGKDGM